MCDNPWRMRLSVGVALLHAGLAHADAPRPPDIDTRWGVGLALGGESFNPTAAGSITESLGYLELAGRFRPVYNTEIQLAIDLGGRDDAKLGALFIDVRYRFNPDDNWRWSLTGGLGVASVAAPDATDAQKKARGALRFGAGFERRLGRFAILAELRLTLITENKDVPDVIQPAPAAAYFGRYGMSSYGFQVGGSYSW